MRQNNIELLAPAGKLNTVKRVALAGADSVYAGGKDYNMRGLRRDFNLERAELKEAADFLHALGKKFYVTVNNIFNNEEIINLEEYLGYLKSVQVDAIIIQDLGLLPSVRRWGLDLDCHISVQAGVCNAETVKLLAEMGAKRVILSKNLSAEEIRRIKAETTLSLEFFVHGDMCVAHTGHCYASAYVSGLSGNRGLCKKPCRWPYHLLRGDQTLNGGAEAYFLAHKDLCLAEHLTDLAAAGIDSFKIEGRMRDDDFLAELVASYREAMDNGYNPALGARLEAIKARLFSTGQFIQPASYALVDTSGTREPFFPTAPLILPVEDGATPDREAMPPAGQYAKPAWELGVKFPNQLTYLQRFKTQVDYFIWALCPFCQVDADFDYRHLEDLFTAVAAAGGTHYLETPPIMKADDFRWFKRVLEQAGAAGVGILAQDYGALRLALEAGLPVIAGAGLNLENSSAAEYCWQRGAVKLMPSTEISPAALAALLAALPERSVSLNLHAPLVGMVSDICLPAGTCGDDIRRPACGEACRQEPFALEDQYRQRYRIFTDQRCYNYILHPFDFSGLTKLPALTFPSVGSMQLDLQLYPPEVIAQLLPLYRAVADSAVYTPDRAEQDLQKLTAWLPAGLCAGALAF
jgi:putative protease